LVNQLNGPRPLRLMLRRTSFPSARRFRTSNCVAFHPTPPAAEMKKCYGFFFGGPQLYGRVSYQEQLSEVGNLLDRGAALAAYLARNSRSHGPSSQITSTLLTSNAKPKRQISLKHSDANSCQSLYHATLETSSGRKVGLCIVVI